MTSTEYWRQREAAQRKKNATDEAEYQKEIRRIYADMLDHIQKEIDAFYTRYADKEGITMAQAKRRVSQLDMDAYSRKAKKYVKNRNFSDQANEELRLYNLTMKVNRLEMLKANVGLELVSGFDELQKFFDQKLTDKTLEEFRRQAGILGKSVQNNQKYAHAIVNASFHNAKFSDRIWMYQDLLKKELEKQLAIGLIQGRSSRVLARAIRDKFQVSQSDAERLMTTELRRVQTEAARQSYERNGNEDYIFLTTNPKGPCPVCAALDGKQFKVKDMEMGVNAPPMHPRCHCTTAPYWDQEAFDRWLDGENQKMHERVEAKANADPFLIGDIAFEALTGSFTGDKINRTFSSQEALEKHYQKHLGEFGSITREEYLQLANEFASAPLSDDVEQIERSDGSISKYRFSTNDFLVITEDGSIRTFFKPKNAKDYWLEEHKRNEKD